ncbi:MAG: hypothetical protein GY846_21140, partial [Deltaproteobacteria bacterium]|nr:hypothetical protein [Deltaproteobacteria bacterium]
LRGSSLLDDLKTSKLKNDIRQLDGALRLMSVGNQPWCAPELGRTGIPVTYFYGEQDIKYKAIALGLPNDIPAISLKAFTQASHNIHLQFLKEIVSALNELLG